MLLIIRYQLEVLNDVRNKELSERILVSFMANRLVSDKLYQFFQWNRCLMHCILSDHACEIAFVSENEEGKP